MKFSDFQTATGTLKKMDTDEFGDPYAVDSLSVKVDPVLGWERVFTDEDEQITGRSTTITTDPESKLKDFWDDTHRNWVLTFREKDWQVAQGTPFYPINSNDLEHVQLVLR